MTEEQLKSSSNYFKIIFKILLFVSSVLFLSVVTSWFVMTNMKIPETPREIKFEKYVETVTFDIFSLVQIIEDKCLKEGW